MQFGEILGKEVLITVDRPLGTFHPRCPSIFYTVNYGYVEGVLAGDGSEQDVYLLGVPVPVRSFRGVVIGVIHRKNDREDKWVAAPKGLSFSEEEIRTAVDFVERFFDTEFFCLPCKKKPLLGVSLAPELLLGKPHTAVGRKLLESFDGWERLLSRLREAGAGSVELRTVSSETPPGLVLEAAGRIWSQGLSLTVHGTLKGGKDGAARSFFPLWSLAAGLRQEKLTVVLHSLKNPMDEEQAKEDTVKLLRSLCGMAPQEVEFALELNRDKGDGDPGTTPEAVEEMAEAAGRRVGVCWDFGHFYSNAVYKNLLDSLPNKSFLRRTVHTHIHALSDGTTHFPLTVGSLSLEQYCRALAGCGYKGIWNLELEPERYGGSVCLRKSFLGSLRMLGQTVTRVVEEIA